MPAHFLTTQNRFLWQVLKLAGHLIVWLTIAMSCPARSDGPTVDATAKQVPLQSLSPNNKTAVSKPPAIKPLKIDKHRDHIRGNVDAPFSLIEYSDFNCAFCRRFHPKAKRLIKDSGGNINWVYRHFPLIAHQPAAQKLAEAAECVAEIGGNTAFWRFTDNLVMQAKSTQEIAQSGTYTLPSSASRAARIALIDKSELMDCVKSGRYFTRVQADASDALRLGLVGTPGNIIINNSTGEWLIRQGAASLQTLQADIASLSEQSPNHPTSTISSQPP